MSGVLPSIIYPSTVADEQKRLAAALSGTNTSVTACASLDPSTRTAWGLFYATALAFTSESAGIFGLGTMMDRAQSYEAELLTWQTKISQSCTLGVPLFNPSADDRSKAFQYAAIAVGAVAGAYVIGQIFTVIPRRR